VEFPDPEILLGEREQDNPEVGLTLELRETVPMKPYDGNTTIVDDSAVPARPIAEAGLAEKAKSCELSTTVFEWVRPPPVAFTVTR
jgi:hypothetical protein